MKYGMKWIQPIADYLVYMLVRVFVCVVQTVPIESCRMIAGGLAVLAADVFGLRRKLVEENLRYAFPQWDEKQRRELTLRMWEHLFLLVAEVAHSPRKIHEVNWKDHIRLVNVEELHQYLCEARAVNLVTGHFGNFELGGYFLGLLGYPSYTVARILDNPYLNRFVNDFREATGQFLIAKSAGPDPIMEVLERHDTMAFLADQSAGRKGCWVDFFNRKASAFKAIALLTLQFDAPLVVCFANRRDGIPMQFELQVVGIYDPRNPIPGVEGIQGITQWYTSLLEEGIRKYPEQYWWVHNRWKSYGRKF